MRMEEKKMEEQSLIEENGENLHKYHRERIKSRFLAEGLDNFDAHNVLELLLFYSIPQKDTNDLSHKLIKKFGCLSAVFDASFDDLLTVDGIGEHSAVLIKLIPELARKYTVDKNKETRTLSTLDEVGQYLVHRYVGVNIETVFLILLDNKYNLIDCVKIHEGSVNSAAITVRRLIEIAIQKHASMAVLAHNHPQGIAIPSSEDIYTTNRIKQAFNSVEIRLLAHVIVANNSYTNILKEEYK